MCIMHEAMEQLASNIACKVCGEKVVGWASIEEEGWGVVGERDGGRGGIIRELVMAHLSITTYE